MAVPRGPSSSAWRRCRCDGRVPMKVPIGVEGADMEKAKMVTMTSGSLAGENKAGSLRRRRFPSAAEKEKVWIERLGVGPGGHAERDADYGGDGDGQQHAALDLHHGEYDGQHEADEEYPQYLVIEVGQARGCGPRHRLPMALGSPGGTDWPTFSMPTSGHEQADAADGVLQDRMAMMIILRILVTVMMLIAAQEYHAHGLLPAEAEATQRCR